MASKKRGDAAGTDKDTSSMYLELTKLQASGDFEKGLKVCNRILNVSPSDATAFHCKIVCLINTSKFDVALQQIKDNDHLSDLDLTFETAYCLYRLNRSDEALSTLDGVSKVTPSSSLRLKELRAQVLYRLERYDECFDLYRDLIKNTSDDFELERLTNLEAVAVNLASSGGAGQRPKPKINEEDSYELCYNKACHLLALGKLPAAESALRKALEVCVQFYQDQQQGGDAEDLEDSRDEIERETSSIRVQLAYCLQLQGGAAREREAQALNNAVLKAKVSDDVALVAVASNNLVTLNRDQNIFDSKKRMKAAMTAVADGMEHKMPKAHRRLISKNNALLAMYTNQVDLCRSLVIEAAEKFGLSTEEKSYILAGVLSRAGKTQEAIDVLASKEVDLERSLVCAQIYLEKGEVRPALGVLQQLPSQLRFRTGVLSAMVTLLAALDDRLGAAQLLKEAVTWYKQQPQMAGKETMAVIWRKTADFHMQGDQPQVAAQALEELLKADPSSKQTMAQLVLAYARFDLKRALEASKRLPDFRQGAVDVDALEAAAYMGVKYVKKAKAAGAASPVPGKTTSPTLEGEAAKKKKSKKRKKRLPKDYNPEVDPDPERWLPKRERTGYRRPRKDRRRGEKFTGAQGTAAGQSEVFDYSQKKATAASGAVPKDKTKSPAMAAQEASGPRQQQRKVQAKKKGKTGKNRF